MPGLIRPWPSIPASSTRTLRGGLSVLEFLLGVPESFDQRRLSRRNKPVDLLSSFGGSRGPRERRDEQRRQVTIFVSGGINRSAYSVRVGIVEQRHYGLKKLTVGAI